MAPSLPTRTSTVASEEVSSCTPVSLAGLPCNEGVEERVCGSQQGWLSHSSQKGAACKLLPSLTCSMGKEAALHLTPNPRKLTMESMKLAGLPLAAIMVPQVSQEPSMTFMDCA